MANSGGGGGKGGRAGSGKPSSARQRGAQNYTPGMSTPF